MFFRDIIAFWVSTAPPIQSPNFPVTVLAILEPISSKAPTATVFKLPNPDFTLLKLDSASSVFNFRLKLPLDILESRFLISLSKYPALVSES